MRDQYGRTINYLRVSITDRCNLRCQYCMPDGVALERHSDILSYEELLRLCAVAVSLGITRFKITGGEPLVRRGCTQFIARLKQLSGVEQVTLTTNGLLLREALPQLCHAGLDGVNISLDTLDQANYQALTGCSGDGVEEILRAVQDCVAHGLNTKVNGVLLAKTFDGLPALAALAHDLPVDVRFIELMPMGAGRSMEGVPIHTALDQLKTCYPDLHPTGETRGNGPAQYYASAQLLGRIGLIHAVSQQFCDGCNRVRLTATGTLKPCLCYSQGVDLRAPLRDGSDDTQLRRAMEQAIYEKPKAHCFSRQQEITECKTMNQIGG